MTDYSKFTDGELNAEIAKRRDWPVLDGIPVPSGYTGTAAQKLTEGELETCAPNYAQDMNAAIDLYAELPKPALFPPNENDTSNWVVWVVSTRGLIDARHVQPARAIAGVWLMYDDEAKAKE